MLIRGYVHSQFSSKEIALEEIAPHPSTLMIFIAPDSLAVPSPHKNGSFICKHQHDGSQHNVCTDLYIYIHVQCHVYTTTQ